MQSNEKLVEFIKADWEAKRMAFVTMMTYPFNYIGFPTYPADPQLFLAPFNPSSQIQVPQGPDRLPEK